MKKKHGWVIEILPKARNYCGIGRIFYGREEYCTSLKTALVVESRRFARSLCYDFEVVRKVSLTKTGKPKKIIGRG